MKLSITGLFKRHVKEEKKPQNIDAGQEKKPAFIIQTDTWKKPSSDGLVDYHAVTGEGTPEYQERQNSLQQMSPTVFMLASSSSGITLSRAQEPRAVAAAIRQNRRINRFIS